MTQLTVKLPTGEMFGPVDEDVLLRWVSEGRVPRDAVLITDGGEVSPAIEHEKLRFILQAPPTRAGPISTRTGAPPISGNYSGLIPYHNPPALIGYYVSVASLIPFFALLLGPVAVILGFAGLKKRREDPKCKGMAHAIVAITLGGLTTVANLAAIAALILLNN
jgi:hypothetical protein